MITKQIELGELKTSLAEAASGLLWTFIKRGLSLQRRFEPAEKKALVCREGRFEPAEEVLA